MVVSQAQDQPKRLTLRNYFLFGMLHLHQFIKNIFQIDLTFMS